MKRVKLGMILFLMLATPLALGSLGKAYASTHGAPAHGEEHAAPAHGGGHEAAASHEAAPVAHGATHEAAPAHGDAHGGEHEAAGHDGGHGHHAPPPVLYYIYWSVLFLGVVMSGFYIIRAVKVGKPHHETLFLAFVFVCMSYFLFISGNYVPSMARHFDMASHSFVDGYHQSPYIGFVSFIYRTAYGAFLTVYAILGMEHH